MIAEEIAEYLEQNYIGTVGEDIFIMQMSDLPDDQVLLRPYGGAPVAGKTGDIEYDLQVLVRDTNVPKGYRRIVQIFDILCKEDKSGIYLPIYDRRIICKAKQYPFSLGYDEKNRHTWDFNLGIISKREVI